MFKIIKSCDKQYYFVLVAKNGETICTGELYKTIAGARKGIRAIKRIAGKAKIVLA